MTTPLGPHDRHSRRHPCPVCGKPEGCITFRDGMTLCFRIESPHRTDTGWYAHWPEGNETRAADWRDRLPPTPPAPPIDHVLCDRAYRSLLRLCPLSAEHRTQLHVRGMDDGEIGRRGYGSLPRDGRDELAAAIVAECGEAVVGGVPGFWIRFGAPTFAGEPGLLVPVRDLDGRVVRLQVRVDDPAKQADGKYRWASSLDHDGGIGSGAPLHIAMPATPTTPGRVGVTEGFIKGDIAADRLGIPVVCVAGVGNTTGVAEAVRALGATEVVALFDMDRTTNGHVARGEQRQVDRLVDAGLPVFRGSWPAAHKGIDDALTAGVLPMIEPVTAPAAESDLDSCPDLRRRCAELQHQLDESRALQSATMAALGNSALNPAERIVAVMLMKNLAVETDRNVAAAEHHIPVARIADQAGVSQSTAAAAIKTIEEGMVLPATAADSTPHPVKLFTKAVRWARDVPDRKTGELRDIKRSFYAPAIGTLSEGLLTISRAEKVEKRAHGGNRAVCELHPDAGVVVKWDKFCAHPGCGLLIESGETRQSPRAAIAAEPVWIDGPPPASGVNGQDAHLLPRPFASSPETFSRTVNVESSHNAEPAWLMEAPLPEPDERNCLAGSDSIAEVSQHGQTIPGVRVDLSSAYCSLAAADHASDRDARHRANDRLYDDLAQNATVRGRTPIPRAAAASPPRRAMEMEYEEVTV